MTDKVFYVRDAVITRYADGTIKVTFPCEGDPEGFVTQRHRVYAHQFAGRVTVRLMEFDAHAGDLTGNRTFIYASGTVMMRRGEE